MIHGAGHSVHDPHRQDGGQVFGGPVGLIRFGRLGDQAAGLGVAAQFAAGLDEVGGDGGQQALGGGAVHQQGLGGAADRDAAHLGVDDDAAGDVEVGGGVQIGVAQALEVAQHGRFRLGLNAGDQALAAARDDQVDGPFQPREDGADGFTIRDGDQLDRVGGQARLRDGAGHDGGDGARGFQAVRAAAQDGGVARAQAQGGGVGGDVGPALVDDAQDADGGADTGDVQTVGGGPAGHLGADRIGLGGDGLDGDGHALDAGGGQGQAVDQGFGQARGAGVSDVAGVGGQDLGLGGAKTGGDARQGLGAGRRRRSAQGVGGGAGAAAHVQHQSGYVGHRVSSTRSSRWITTEGPR